MFIGIERNTDLHNPDTKVRKFKTERAALNWLKEGKGDFAYPGAARENLPASQQNWHKRFRYVYEMPKYFRVEKKEINKRIKENRGSSYHRSGEDVIGDIYIDYSVRKLKVSG